ncbi:MAG TPA: phosphate signaling complex protein PhoU [Acidobacteriota bacterium]|nr:phosphate signaling complex protein PhoU [Acidobacteriota bacterium]
MTRHLHRDLDGLKKELLAMGTLVEEATSKAILALVNRRPELAEEVRCGDKLIDIREVEVEEHCLKVLALHQPVAHDLRFIVAVMKVNNDLERMGDLAVNIAERAAFLTAHDPIAVPLRIQELGEKVRAMVRGSLDALINRDPVLARQICADDDEVDAINRDFYTRLQAAMRENPEIIERAINVLSASRHLERMADSATNIAEDVIFMVEGEIVRHRLGG